MAQGERPPQRTEQLALGSSAGAHPQAGSWSANLLSQEAAQPVGQSLLGLLQVQDDHSAFHRMQLSQMHRAGNRFGPPVLTAV